MSDDRSRNDDPEAEDLYKVIERMCVALRLRRPAVSEALRIAADARRDRPKRALERQDRALDRWADRDKPPPAPRTPERLRRPRQKEQARRRLFALARPATILAPANIVAVYLHAHAMWKSWGWAETAAVNAKMLPFVQRLDARDPLPDDPRLALPLTVAGFMLYRALETPPAGKDRTSPAVMMDVYREIAEGIIILTGCLEDAARRQIRGDVLEDFLGHFAHTVAVAETLLLHAVRLGPEMWALILKCPLSSGCRLGAPYYVTPPDTGKPHSRCRTAKSRAKAPVTLKLVTAKK